MAPDARSRFFILLQSSVNDGSLTKLTLGKYRGADATVQNLYVRPTSLKSGPHLTFVWRHATRDVTKNLAPAAAIAEIEALVGSDFLDAHLFTATTQAQLESNTDGSARIRIIASPEGSGPGNRPGVATHDRAKHRPIASDAPWLRALGVTNDRGQPREGMADKFRQIQKFAELLQHLLNESGLLTAAADTPGSTPDAAPAPALRVVDMGSGKGYLTFAIASLIGSRATVEGVEARPELTELCNRIAREQHLAPALHFTPGTITDTPLPAADVLIALHACDTATDDALAKGISAGARLLVVSPCCQKELRSQLTAPPVLAGALQHGIFQERQSEFVTDALRAQLLEWAGYRTKVFEFISTEHTAKNIMIAAIKTRDPGKSTDAAAERVREFAAFYGIRHQQLAKHLGFEL
jgi:SAM-dependent methyltransferase